METSSISSKCTFNLPSVYFLVYHLTSKKDHFSLSTTVSLSILLCHPLKSLTMLIVREIKTLSCSLLFRLRVLPLIVHCHLGYFFHVTRWPCVILLILHTQLCAHIGIAFHLGNPSAFLLVVLNTYLSLI